MSHWLNLGQNLAVNAKKFPDTVAVKDCHRSYTYPELNGRVNKLAHSLIALGLKKGDRIGALMENSIEIIELFLATAKTGIVIVPINFRLVGREIRYILENADARALLVHDEFTPTIDEIKPRLSGIRSDCYIVVGEEINGYRAYEKWIANSPDIEVNAHVTPKDIWVLIYTSGTTGRPKGVLRSHESHIAFYLINAVDFAFTEHDTCLNVMPLTHINSIFFSFIFTYIGGSVYVHPARSFQAEEILAIIEAEKITFISLIPLHYNLILNVAEEAKSRDISSIKTLLCSSAPARRRVKLKVMDFFPGVRLFEAYGSTEGGIVTILKPEDQLEKLGSIGYESLGTDFVKVLDEDGEELPTGEVGELYSRGPMLFDSYHKLPEITAAAFKDGYFSARDMGYRDDDGFFHIVDRKDNMIITGGENVYPSSVEEVVGNHEAVFDVAVIGLPDEKWGEKVVAVVIPKAAVEKQEIIDFCRDKLAAFRRPKEIIFIAEQDMPRTATGKILHRILRERFTEQLKKGDARLKRMLLGAAGQKPR